MRIYLISVLCLGSVVGQGLSLSAELQRTELTAVADIAIVEGINNSHAAEHGGAVTTIDVGTMNRGDSFVARRGLLRFDLSSIPANARIELALLSLRRVFSDDAGAGADQSPLLSVHRLLRPWDETSGSAATWGQARFGYDDWSEPGANGGEDRAVAPTDFTNPFLSGLFLTLDVTPDVRDFISGTANNYGWVLIGPEGAHGRYFVRFNARERDVDETEKPRLILYWNEASAD